MKRNAKKWYVGIIFLLLVVLTACQSVEGIDLNKSLLEQLKVKSGESSQSMSWNFEIDPNADVTAEELSMLDKLKSGSIEVHTKSKDELNGSASGSITLAGKTIPFKLYTNDQKFVMQVESSKNLLSASLANSSTLEDMDLGFISGLKNDLEFRDELMSTLIRNLPNPKNTTIDFGHKTSINGEEVTLSNVKMEVQGTNLHEVIIDFIDNLLHDETNVKKLLNTALSYDQELSESDRKTEADDMMEQYRKFLSQLQVDLSNDDEAIYKMLNNRNNYIKLETGIDSSFKIRSTKAEIYYRIPKVAGMTPLPIRSAKITLTGQNWNINEAVAVDQPAANSKYTDIESITSPRSFIKQLDSASSLYDLLHNDLKLSVRTGEFYSMIGEDLSRPGQAVYADGHPYVKQGTMMIGAKQLATSMEFGLAWDKKQKTVVLKDNGNYVVFRLGSKQANANGKSVTLTQAPQVLNNYIYIPLKSAAVPLKTTIQLQSDIEYGTTLISLKVE
ncbi:copper amine oxidase N-terminal domain-containing protein [Paenibacillus solisilvae]|uniref:Copper amine oxidase N-terminal domain-containing protein n=1 Tax=Paenibacillus solisilvae TaxID=2486751 RepID=A0ABW0VUN6_9BACL